MAEQVCTATGDGNPENPLFEPPCDCPDCAPTLHYDHDGSRIDDGWLRISGRRQRYRVEPFALGATGRALLG